MTSTQLTLFDYNALDSETRVIVQQKAVEIRDRMRSAAQAVIEIGERLIDVKERLGHGKFGQWLDAEFQWSADTARNYMNVAERFGQNPKISEFAPSALYLLAAPSTPEDARTEAITLAEQGQKITHAVAKQIVSTHKEQALPKPNPAAAPAPKPEPKLEIPPMLLIGDQAVPSAEFTGISASPIDASEELASQPLVETPPAQPDLPPMLTIGQPSPAAAVDIDTKPLAYAIVVQELARQMVNMANQRVKLLEDQIEAQGKEVIQPFIDTEQMAEAAASFIETPAFKSQAGLLAFGVKVNLRDF
ncbi:DUF3102 domain-containing protein [Herpetosiphon giganteus]|uniref:DUF3102 domain-containing protein n=1 Tax=Herpetosiphon giganteus TaxID=2029754 RepID=UPI00195AB32A|nr:DUF3102 domain-containing protein [Herpetosiphon giganteus]MBM7843787.1 hypothetical protein [Herpetosiphon giganteus]